MRNGISGLRNDVCAGQKSAMVQEPTVFLDHQPGKIGKGLMAHMDSTVRRAVGSHRRPSRAPLGVVRWGDDLAGSNRPGFQIRVAQEVSYQFGGAAKAGP